MRRFIIGSLHFTRRERFGAVALTLIGIVVFITPEIASYYAPPATTDFSRFQTDIQAFRSAMQTTGSPDGQLFFFDPNTASSEDFVRLGLSEKVAGIIGNYRNKGGKFRLPEDFQKIWSLPKEDFERLLPYIRIGSDENEKPEKETVLVQREYFAFDPNTASESDLLRLGLPQGTVRGILNYRSKGGIFRKKEDFRKIYTLKEEDYLRLEPYITLGQSSAAVEITPVSYAGGSNSDRSPQMSTRALLDINRASAEDWQRLPGIGEKRAAQIVHFRESLGGFLSVGQVGEMYGLPDSVFQKIRPMLEPGTVAMHKIDLNTASVEDLDKHPYISGKQAKLVVAYRDQHGAFTSVNDLTKIAAFTDGKWLEKVKPYLDAR